MKVENSENVNYPDLGTMLPQVSLDTTLTLLVTPKYPALFQSQYCQAPLPSQYLPVFFFFLVSIQDFLFIPITFVPLVDMRSKENLLDTWSYHIDTGCPSRVFFFFFNQLCEDCINIPSFSLSKTIAVADVVSTSVNAE